MWSVLVWLTAYFPAYNVEDWLAAGSTWREYAAHVPPIGAAWWVAALYCSYYVLLEPFAGVCFLLSFVYSECIPCLFIIPDTIQSLFTPVIFTLVYLADRFLLAYGTETACLYALYVHVLSWIMQFVGHGLFEKRAPALLDSLLQGMS